MNHDRVADAATGLAASSWLTTMLAPINEIAHLVLTLVGIASGCAATWYYIRKGRQ
jgi:hypothetical protein